MKNIEQYIMYHQHQFTKHDFYKHLDEVDTIEEFAKFVPVLTFWVMTFQDILTFNTQNVTDPYLKRIARHHEIEDKNHNLWFLDDMNIIVNDSEDRDIAWLFNETNSITRKAAYLLMAEGLKCSEDIFRIILLMTLESSGHIFFEKVADKIKELGYDDKLKYFSSYHLEVEKNHALFEEELEAELMSMQLTDEQRVKAITMIDNMYEAFVMMFDNLLNYFDSYQAIEEKKAKDTKDSTEGKKDGKSVEHKAA